MYISHAALAAVRILEREGIPYAQADEVREALGNHGAVRGKLERSAGRALANAQVTSKSARVLRDKQIDLLVIALGTAPLGHAFVAHGQVAGDGTGGKLGIYPRALVLTHMAILGNDQVIADDVAKLGVGKAVDGVANGKAAEHETYGARHANDGHEHALLVAKEVSAGDLLRKVETIPHQ